MANTDHVSLIQRLVANDYRFDVVYDCGANRGAWSKQMQGVLPEARYELFEPLQGRHETLDASSVADVLSDKTSWHPVALSDEAGTLPMKVLGNRGVGSSLLITEQDRRRDDRVYVDVPVYRLDDYRQAHDLPPPDLLKLDVQAAEIKLLTGAAETMKNTKFILAETWMRRGYGPETPLFHELATFLYGHDFVLFDILLTEGGYDPNGDLRFFDGVFIHRDASPHPNVRL